MIGYTIGPVLALLISLKFNQVNQKKAEDKILQLEERIELTESRVDVIDKETLKKMMVTLTPVARAVKELQEAIGVQ
jgi:gas vesicle protein